MPSTDPQDGTPHTANPRESGPSLPMRSTSRFNSKSPCACRRARTRTEPHRDRRRGEVEPLGVVTTLAADDGFDQRFVAAGRVDAGGESERFFEQVGVARAEDPLPLIDPLHPGVAAVPRAQVLGLRTDPPRTSDVQHGDIVVILARPARLSGPATAWNSCRPTPGRRLMNSM